MLSALETDAPLPMATPFVASFSTIPPKAVKEFSASA
jgi:hypothetical protein